MENAGIIWRTYKQTLQLLSERSRPVLAFVLDEDGTNWPFFREIFNALPGNEKLRHALNGSCIPMLLKADSLPSDLRDLGAGRSYHIAILSPAGLTPLIIFEHRTGNPAALIAEIGVALEKLSLVWNG